MIKVKKRKQDVRKQGLDVSEGSELGNIHGHRKKDQMHGKVANQTVKIIKKKEREGVPVSYLD